MVLVAGGFKNFLNFPNLLKDNQFLQAISRVFSQLYVSLVPFKNTLKRS